MAGSLGLIPLFSDSPTLWINVAELVLIFFGFGLLIGWLHPRRWWVAGFAAWSGLGILAAGLVTERQFRDAPVLTVWVGDGHIRTAPYEVEAQRFTLHLRNEGRQVHELQVFRGKLPK